MREVILNFPKQFQAGLKAAAHISKKVNFEFENVVICGVGGSALPASLLWDYADDLKIPLYIHRSYGLAKQTNEKSLIVCISFSGNTEETLSGYEQAIKMGLTPIAITTGGKLKQGAEKNNLPVAVVPNDCLQPRMGTGYLFAALLKILSNCNVLADKTKEMLQTAESLNPSLLEEQGKALAQKLIGKIPLIYASHRFKSCARVWKIKFNENSKIMAFWNYFPELNHNEMVGYTKIQSAQFKVQNYFVIILKDKDDNPQILKRMELTASFIKEAGYEVDLIEMQGATKLEKIFNALLLGDWTSYYLALAYEQDPLPVKIVEEFKKHLSQ